MTTRFEKALIALHDLYKGRVKPRRSDLPLIEAVIAQQQQIEALERTVLELIDYQTEYHQRHLTPLMQIVPPVFRQLVAPDTFDLWADAIHKRTGVAVTKTNVVHATPIYGEANTVFIFTSVDERDLLAGLLGVPVAELGTNAGTGKHWVKFHNKELAVANMLMPSKDDDEDEWDDDQPDAI